MPVRRGKWGNERGRAMHERGMAGARLATAGALVLGLSGCWLQPGQNAGHTYANPSESELTAANVADLEELWSTPVSGAVGEPIVSGDRVYQARVATGGTGPSAVINAVDAATGTPLWSDALVNGPSASTVQVLPPAEVDGELWTGYAIGEQRPQGPACRGERVRLDAATGAHTGEEDGFGSTAVSSGDVVVQRQQHTDAACGTGPSTVVVRDGESLATIWSSALPGASAASGETGPTVVGDRAIVTYNDTVRAYDLAGCGTTVCPASWTYTAPFGSIPVGPAVAGPGGHVLVVQYDTFANRTYLMVMSSVTGNQVWRATVGVGIDGQQVRLAVAGDTIYAVVPDGATRQLQAYAGAGCGAPICSPAWTASTSTAGSSGNLAVAGDVVYVPDGDGIDAFPADGCGAATCSAITTIPSDSAVDAVVVSGGRLYAVGADGTLTAFATT